LPELVDNPNLDPKSLAEKHGLLQESDSDAIMEHVEAVIAAYPDKVLEYQAGKKGLIGLFMGEVMKRSRGAADPKVATQLLRDKLES
jgi:aspartyl-tRNA(Asn)/glutamyl-tRNA(Gln) amidotransferase subunit B